MCMMTIDWKRNGSNSYRNGHDENPLKRNCSHLYNNVHDENPFKKKEIVIRTEMCMTKIYSNWNCSHSYGNVHDENPFKKKSIVIRTEMCFMKTNSKEIDSLSYRIFFWTKTINYPRLVHPFIYQVLRRSFMTVIRRSLLTGRGHIVSPRCQSVRRWTSRFHTGYQRFRIPQVQVAPIVRKACLTIVSQFIHSTSLVVSIIVYETHTQGNG